MIRTFKYIIALLLLAQPVFAATYSFTDGDSMTEIRDCIEGDANACDGTTLAAGDTVNLAPGFEVASVVISPVPIPTLPDPFMVILVLSPLVFK